MIEFIEWQKDYLCFIYGLGFLLVAVPSFLLGRSGTGRLKWGWLGMFGVFECAAKWMDLVSAYYGDDPFFKVSHIVVSIISLLCVFEFARSGVEKAGVWIYAPLMALIWLGGYALGVDGVYAVAQDVLGLIGGMWAAYALYSAAREEQSAGKGYLIACAALIAAYTTAQSVGVTEPIYYRGGAMYWSYGPSAVLVIHSLIILICFLTGATLFAYWFAVNITRSYGRGSGFYRAAVLFFLLLVCVIAGGWAVTDVVGRNRSAESKESLLGRAKTVAAMLGERRLSDLTGTDADLSSPIYTAIHEELSAITASNKDVRFAYLLGMKDDKVCFLADSENPGSPDASPPGQIYDEATPQLINSFTTGASFTEGPVGDRWGVWISALSPIRDISGRRIAAVFGMDIAAARWKKDIITSRLASILFVTALCIIIIIAYVMVLSNHASIAEIAESENRFRSIFERAPEGLFIMDPETKDIIEANPRLLRMLGYDRSEFMTLSLSQIMEGTDAGIQGNIDRAMTEGTAYFGVGRWRREDGSVLDAEVNASRFSLRGKDRLVVFVHDISARRKMEKMKDEFVSMVTHELKTPLSSIKEGISVILDELVGSVSARQRDFLELAGRNVDRLSRLVGNILDFQKLQMGKMTFDIAPCDINLVVKEVCDIMRPHAESKKIELEEELAWGIPQAAADRDKIIQVLINLINNAIKFTDKGKILIRTLSRTQSEVTVLVSDTGIGIGKEDITKLFTSFGRLIAHDNRPREGTGLGLAISKDIIQRHGGTIWAESEPGKGSTFIFTLPVA